MDKMSHIRTVIAHGQHHAEMVVMRWQKFGDELATSYDDSAAGCDKSTPERYESAVDSDKSSLG